MRIELKVPVVGESITEVVISEWLKSEGDRVEQDEAVATLETDKVDVELLAPKAGVLRKILKGNGEEAEVGEVVGYLEAGEKSEGSSDEAPEEESEAADEGSAETPHESDSEASEETADAAEPAPKKESKASRAADPPVSPAARRALAEAGLEAADVEGSGSGGRILKEDVQRRVAEKETTEEEPASEPAPAPPTRKEPASSERASAGREEEVVKMTPLRRRVAERLVESQHTAALLTTFNEIDMSRVMALRKQYQDSFVEKYGIKLGFMSFFTKAAIEALKEVPQVNAEIRDETIVYRNYQDIGVAVGGGKGLVVPVIRNAERLSFAEVEKTIADLAGRARDNKLKLEELQGGTFTISNGGIYGSLLSTPIVNPPQSGILGLHKIEERPIAVNGEVVIRPMMYVALTYDHRIVDGREAVTFLVKIKERIEDPTRILLEV